jgi:hypothetical protein
MPIPAVAAAGLVTKKCVAVDALTKIGLLTPVMVVATVSAALIVWLPAVSKAAINVPTPFVSVP